MSVTLSTAPSSGFSTHPTRGRVSALLRRAPRDRSICRGKRRLLKTFHTGGCERDLRNPESVERYPDSGLLREILDVCGIAVACEDREVVRRSCRPLHRGSEHPGGCGRRFAGALIAHQASR
jgi:hypothetical protein